MLLPDDHLPYGSVDVVLGCEIVEHMSDNELDVFVEKALSYLKEGGYIVLTTPKDENLTENITVCPDCGCYFHTSQHVRSWDAESLKDYLGKYGIVTQFIIKKSLVGRNTFIRKVYSSIYNNIFIKFKKPRNLIYIGKKTSYKGNG